MSRFSVEWRAEVKEAGADVAGRFARVLEELSAYQKVVAPAYETDEGGRVSFGFTVEGFSSALLARAWAERAMQQSLHHARVGAPELPDGGEPTVRVMLDGDPVVRPIAE